MPDGTVFKFTLGRRIESNICRRQGINDIGAIAGALDIGGVRLSIPGLGRRASEGMQRTIEAHREQLEAWERLCATLGHEPADVALAWLLHQPAVTAPIIGPRTLAQFEGNLFALEIDLSEETLAKIDEIWPGPGGAAPAAYAW